MIGMTGNRCRPWPRSRSGLAALLGLMVAAAWSAAPHAAVAGTRCNDYCSGPHKDYKDCMDRCIAQEEASHPRQADRSIRELCAAKGQDEERCLREHGFGSHGEPYYPPPVYAPPPAYVQPPVYAPPPPVYAPPPPVYAPPPAYVPQQPMQCYRDPYNRLICQPN